MRRAAAPLLAVLLSACGSAAVGPARPSASAPIAPTIAAPTTPADDVFEPKTPLRDERLVRAPDLSAVTGALPDAPRGLAGPPARCDAFVRRDPAPGAFCEARPSTRSLDALATALERADTVQRDAELRALESCAELPPGLARALRAELAPIECADALVDAPLKSPSSGMAGSVRTAMLGLGFAARLARTVGAPPAPPHGASSVQDMLKFAKGTMFVWMDGQARNVQELSMEGAKLPYYGKALVAIEAGLAELRMVEAVRNVPLPDALAADAELRDAYYVALDEALEPRKTRGRDAALVGLGIFAHVGAIEDPRVLRARALIAKMYGGRRIDALDKLALPPLAPSGSSTTIARLAATLPTFYTSQLLPASAALDPDVLRALIHRGVGQPERETLASATLSADASLLYARARLALGQRYWRALDFDQAAALALASLKAQPSDEARFLVALALALRDGPEDASALLLRAPVVALGMGQTAALDAVAASASPIAPLAAFDAALVREVAPPSDAGPAYWSDVARRWDEAAKRVASPTLRAFASERASAADQIARSIHGPS